MLVAMAKNSKVSDSGSVRPRTGLHWDLMTYRWTG